MLTFLANSFNRNKLTSSMENSENNGLSEMQEKYDEMFDEEEITSNYKFIIF